MNRKLAFAIHHLNPWGGHDRSTLEVIRRISQVTPVHLYSYSIHDPKMKEWGQYEFHPVRPHIRRPAVILLTVYYLKTLWMLYVLPRLKRESRPLVHATGACSWVSDVIQVQFVQTAWNEKRKQLAKGTLELPSSGWEQWIQRKIRRIYHSLLLKYNLWVERAVYRKDKTYIAIAQCVADELKHYFGIEKNVHVIHHGVDSQQFCPTTPETQLEREQIRQSLGLTPQQTLVIFVGEYERKGLGVAIRSLALLSPQARKNMKLAAVGTGDSRAYLELAQELGVKDQLILLGHQKGIERYFRAAEIFLLPTLYEPFGLVTIEAMASGLAPIVSASTGASELIADDISGKLLQDPADPSEASKALEYLILNPDQRIKMSQAAREVAEKRNWDQVAREYLNVLLPKLKYE
jgi:UDP-glucose:(heptosyl)LPS alpha-1,3-glucosyltransferase